MKRRHVLATLVGLFAAATASRIEAAESGRVEVRLETELAPATGAQPGRCTTGQEIDVGAKAAFRVSFGTVRPKPEGGWERSTTQIRCEKSSPDNRPRPQPSSDVPYLDAELSVTPLRSTATTTNLAVFLILRRLSGLSPAGEPIYHKIEQYRSFSLEVGGGDGLIPMLVGDESSSIGPRNSALVLHVAARRLGRQGTDYGSISVRSTSPGAEVLLDQGRIGRTDRERNLFLRAVPVGVREVRVREGGREALRVVRILKDRTVLVAPGFPPRSNALAPIGKNKEGYEQYRRNRDGAVIVRVPEGEFHMGNLDTEGHPQPHVVSVSEFLIDKTPVTWAQYKLFLEASGWPLPPDEPYWGIQDDQPAVFVTWEESRAFCEWVGGRLPNEAEREKAARGTDERKYPWGDEEPNPTLATFRHNWGYEASTPVESHPAGASPYGLLDMGGNVWEWVEDWWDADYFQVSPKTNPRGPATGRAHVVKGGSWDSRPSVLSASSRNFGYLGYREGDFGFRCAADAPSPEK